MACPWFKPTSEADFASRPRPARAPLGSIFTGVCELRQTVPSESLLFGACNFGYGRGSCPSFPADSESDAVRFTAVGERTVWILERDHSPVRYGSCDGPFPSAAVEQQAQIFLCTCLKK
jgi:hypothetical protein